MPGTRGKAVGRASKSGVAGLVLLAAALLPVEAVRSQSIYRCDDGRGGVLYTDAPCKQGTAVDVAAGKASPEAIARLEREQQAFQQRQMARDAKAERDDRAARSEREAERKRRQEAELAAQRLAEQNAGYGQGSWWGWYPAWPVVPPIPRPPRPPRPELMPPSGTVPAHPRVPGR